MKALVYIQTKREQILFEFMVTMVTRILRRVDRDKCSCGIVTVRETNKQILLFFSFVKAVVVVHQKLNTSNV